MSPERNLKLARTVGQRLEELRQEAGISARELSERIGKDRLYFYCVEDSAKTLYVADFVALVLALDGKPATVLSEAVKVPQTNTQPVGTSKRASMR